MSRFNSPLDNIRVASPCPADWAEMYGDERKRFCGECKLNVYNLSGMTRREADDLITNWEGRLCVRFYRRADGSVLTKDCPVGWAAVKRRLSRAATAAFSLFAGIFTGMAGASYLESESTRNTKTGNSPKVLSPLRTVELMGDIVPERDPVMGEAAINETWNEPVNGQVTVGMRTVIVTPAMKNPTRRR